MGTNIDRAIIGQKHMYYAEIMKLVDTANNAIPKTLEEIGFNTDIVTKVAGNKNVQILFDPEGLISTMSAIAQVIFGYVIGSFIIEKGNTRKTVEWLMIVGLGLGIIGTIWHEFFPVNKKIWTSSYTVLTTGMATLFIGFFIYLFEIKKLPQIFGKFFNAFGKNPLFIFVLSGALPRLLGLIRIPNGLDDKGVQKFTSPLAWLYKNVFKDWSSDLQVGSFAYAIFMILFYWLIAYIMDKKKIYVKV
jgi:predicted acyltransferase